MKELIFIDKNRLEPIGGPTGYLYNLNKELENEKCDFIYFLDSEKQIKHMKYKNILKKSPKFIQKIYYSNKKKKYGRNILHEVFDDKKRISDVNLDEYDIIHFHEPLGMYNIKDSLDKYNGIVILTSHSPKVGYKEIIDRIPKKEYEKDKDKFDKLEIIDRYAFSRADYLIFPCEDAEEPYYNTWEYYKKIKKDKEGFYKYVPTGIPFPTIKYSKKEIREKYNIPHDAFVISYIGRHNEIKGYDNLKRIGEQILKNNKNVYFLIAGKEEPLSGLNDNRWIEVGWTRYAEDLVNASDLFVLPNRETYFDLVLLEVMSLGKAIVLTNTGGNRYFKKYDSNGLLYFEKDNINQAVIKIEEAMNNKNIINSNDNKSIFEKDFTVEKFTKNYIKTIKEIHNEQKEGKK